MSKTLEVFEQKSELAYNYEVVSPDHDERYYVDSVIYPSGGRVLLECGASHFDIEEDEYFHIKEDGDNLVEITVEDTPQQDQEFSVPYRCSYTSAEIISECGLPNKDSVVEEHRYMPHVILEMVYRSVDGSSEVQSVDVGGEVFTRDD